MKELAKKINITEKGIEWNINKLRLENRLERIGPTKGGYWKVKKDK